MTVPTPVGTINPTAVVSVDSPTNPFHETISSILVPIHYEILTDDFASTLKMTFDDTVGHIDLYVELDASERFASADVTSDISSVTIDNESVQFEPRYYSDVATCLRAFLNQLPHQPPLFFWCRYLPDPPPDFVRSFRELEVIVRELRGLFRIAPAEARTISRLLLQDLSVGDATLVGILERGLELEGDDRY